MQGDTYYMENTDGDNTLSFASPLSGDDRSTSWHNASLTYRYDVSTIILEDVSGPMRATYSVWDRNADSGQWDLTDSEPGIVELLADQQYDEPCRDCLAELPTLPDFEHSDDCAIDDDGVCPEGWEGIGYFCCEAARYVIEEAHRVSGTSEAHRVYRESNDVTCSLYPDFVLLDGGDVVCRHHCAESFSARWLWIGDDYGEPNRNALLRKYFGARAHNLDNVPDTTILRDLASLERSRRIIDHADHERARRDNVVARLRGNVTQATVGKWSGVSQQRVAQINGEADERARELRERLESGVATQVPSDRYAEGPHN